MLLINHGHSLRTSYCLSPTHIVITSFMILLIPLMYYCPLSFYLLLLSTSHSKILLHSVIPLYCYLCCLNIYMLVINSPSVCQSYSQVLWLQLPCILNIHIMAILAQMQHQKVTHCHVYMLCIATTCSMPFESWCFLLCCVQHIWCQ